MPIAESRDVTSCRIFKATVHVQQVVLVRKEDGKVAAYDAYCPHLGADLSVGGELVHSNGSLCLKCPFHGWLFDSSDGTCVQVPYAKDQSKWRFSNRAVARLTLRCGDSEAPTGTRLNEWRCVERNGFVCVWFHAEREEPTWFPPSTPEIDAGDWRYGGRTESLVNCHLQEIPENGADVGHLNAIHAPSMVWGKVFGSWTRTALANFFSGSHHWTAEWRVDEQDKHLAKIRITQSFSLFGLTIISLDIDVQQVGSSLVLLRFTCPQADVCGLLSQAVVPIASNKQRILHHVYMKQSVKGRLFSRLMLFGEANMVS